jgi:3-oxoacyl-[acyl-carrier-protein] synthase-1
MAQPAYIVNTGLITAIGNDTESCKASLLAERSGVGKAEHLQTYWKDEFPVAEVKASNEELAAKAGVATNWPRTALLSAVAVAETWLPYADRLQGMRIGFFSANTVGGMDLTEQVYKQFKQAPETVPMDNLRHHECGAITQLVAQHFGFDGFVTTISTACSSSANSIMMAAQMIGNGCGHSRWRR